MKLEIEFFQIFILKTVVGALTSNVIKLFLLLSFTDVMLVDDSGWMDGWYVQLLQIINRPAYCLIPFFTLSESINAYVT